MTKREWVEDQIGKGILNGMDDTCYDFYYKAMHDLGIGFYDAERWGWLNTLFGYDIGHEAAREIINYQYETDGDDVMEFEFNNKDTLEHICSELMLELDFKKFAGKPQTEVKYDWR